MSYSYYEMLPVYMQPEAMNKIESLNPQAIMKAGKIYLHHDWILINEPEKGVHILDNSDSKAPVKLAFIAIPGNHDVLVTQNAEQTILYADNYADLITIDITTPRDIKVLKRLEQVFGHFYPQPIDLPGPEPRGFVVGYTQGKKLSGRYHNCSGLASAPPSPDTSPRGTSLGGSLARFASLGSFLYTIDGDAIQSFRLESPGNPVVFNRVSVDFGIETLFPYQGKNGNQLYVGGNRGMYIMDASDPGNLRKQGAIQHLQSCDPVVVQDDLAYVTLQGSCFNQSNRLEIIDVSDPDKPSLIVDYALQEPYGLGIDGDHLFVCDGAAGLKVYDHAREPKKLELLHQFGDIKARDIIPVAGNAIVIAENGFFQYDYSALAEGKLSLPSSIIIPEPSTP